jgi:hypothetical protein
MDRSDQTKFITRLEFINEFAIWFENLLETTTNAKLPLATTIREPPPENRIFDERYYPLTDGIHPPFRIMINHILLHNEIDHETLAVVRQYVEDALIKGFDLSIYSAIPLIFATIMVASKVTEDKGVHLEDFMGAFPNLNLAYMTRLEKRLLEVMSFEVEFDVKRYVDVATEFSASALLRRKTAESSVGSLFVLALKK